MGRDYVADSKLHLLIRAQKPIYIVFPLKLDLHEGDRLQVQFSLVDESLLLIIFMKHRTYVDV